MEMTFKQGTDVRIQELLTGYLLSGKPVRIFLGDTDTGRDWLETCDIVGTIGRSTGPLHVPLLVPKNKHYGCAVLTHCIVKLIDVETGKPVYQHPKYHYPTLQIKPDANSDRFKVVDSDMLTHYVSSKAMCTRWKNFIEGKRSTL